MGGRGGITQLCEACGCCWCGEKEEVEEEENCVAVVERVALEDADLLQEPDGTASNRESLQ